VVDVTESASSMRLVTADTTTVTEIVKSHVPVPNTLGPRDNFGRIRFVVRLTLTDGTKFLPYRQRLFAGNGKSSNIGGKRQAGMVMMVRLWLETWIRLKRE